MHDPANELYDCACDLLDAARRLAAAAAVAESAPARPATLGCVGDALEQLAALAIAGGHDDLEHALRHAAASADAARAAAGCRFRPAAATG